MEARKGSARGVPANSPSREARCDANCPLPPRLPCAHSRAHRARLLLHLFVICPPQAINRQMESKVSISEKAEVRQFYPPPEKDASPRRAFDMSAALGRSMAPLLGSHHAVTFESTAVYETAVRALRERSDRASSWPHARKGEPAAPRPKTKQLRDLRAEMRERHVVGEHYVPCVKDTLIVRRDGLLRGGIDDETRPWMPVQLATNEGLTPSLELLQRRRTGGRALTGAAAHAGPEARAAAEQREREGFSKRSLLFKPQSAQEMRAAAATELRSGGTDEPAETNARDWLNGKPSAYSFRGEDVAVGRMLDSGKRDMDLVSRPPPSGTFVRETMRGGVHPMRLLLTENEGPSAPTKARSGTIRGQWAEDGRTRSAGEAGGSARHGAATAARSGVGPSRQASGATASVSGGLTHTARFAATGLQALGIGKPSTRVLSQSFPKSR